MATENPMRIMDGSRAPKWDQSRGTAAFASPVTSAVTDELGLLLRGHNIHRDQSEIAPNRSGSAPPSMEGSFAAFGNLLNQQRVSSGIENVQPEDMLQAGPLYSSYYNWRPPSDGRGGAPVYMPRSTLSTHEEDPEDDRSNEGAADERAEISNIMLGQSALSFGGRHKSLVDLIQEDFPRTPSPVFASKNRSSSHVEEPFHHDMQSLSLDSLSLEASKLPEPNQTTATKDPSALPIPTNSSLDSRGRSISPHKDQIASKDARFTSDFVSDGTISSDASDNLHKLEDNQDKQQLGFDQQNQPHLQNTYSHHNAGYHIPVPQEQATGQRANSNRVMPHGVAPPLYATSAAYMAPGNSYYGNLSSAGLYTPQYSGYTMGSSYLPPYMAGYPPHSGFLHFNANSGQSFSGQSAGIPTGESVSKGSVMQNLNRFYGQHGLTMHPPFPDPLSLQYFQHDPYGVPLQYSHLPSPGDQKFQFSPTGSVSVPSPRSMGVPSSGYLSSPTGLGFVPQFPASPLGSPVLPQSPVGGASPFGRRYDVGFSQSSPRSASGFARWQGPRGTDSINDHRKHSFLEELKATSARRIDLSDIVGRIVEFSIDQHGSRFIQQKLENCSVEEKESVFKEVLPNASKLMTDVFGNYVIQKFFEHGTYEQRKGLASQLSGQMLPLSLQMYGCRVIQKALEVIEVEQKTELVRELDGHVMRCVRDQNGNHVIQKCIECIPVENIEFVISSFHGQVAALSTHPYGCRVIQRVLEHCSDDERCRSIVDEILESAYDLAHDQYGNYVTQHVLERGKPFERSQIISKLSGKVVQMSQHKYASNVVEKCLEFGDIYERELLIEEILDQPGENDNLLSMMKDQFANYVVQKILEISNDNQREILLGRIRQHIIALKKYTYGKHIVARFEQLCGEDDGTSEP